MKTFKNDLKLYFWKLWELRFKVIDLLRFRVVEITYGVPTVRKYVLFGGGSEQFLRMVKE